jgi:hypothetical protein
MAIDSNFLVAVTILAVIIAFIGAIQLTFQAQMDRTLDEILENRNQNVIADQQRALLLNLSKISIPLILDTDEDIEQMKTKLNITRDSPDDKIHIDVNTTHITIDNGTTIEIADFIPLTQINN